MPRSTLTKTCKAPSGPNCGSEQVGETVCFQSFITQLGGYTVVSSPTMRHFTPKSGGFADRGTVIDVTSECDHNHRPASGCY